MKPRTPYRDVWPKAMFFCTACDEQTDSDPCDRCGGEGVLHWKVVPETAHTELEKLREALAAADAMRFQFSHLLKKAVVLGDCMDAPVRFDGVEAITYHAGYLHRLERYDAARAALASTPEEG